MRGSLRGLGLVLVASTVLAAAVTSLSSPAAAGETRALSRAAAGETGDSSLARSTAVVGHRPAAPTDDLAGRFLTTRPPVGPTWVVDLGPEPARRLITARTLQGVVNRSAARLYFLTPGDEGDQHWLDDYQSRGLVTVAGTTDLDGALDRFASEASGYVLADEAEPWTIDVAATIAAARHAIVATPDEVAGLAGRGLSLIEDTRGRWSDAASAYEATAATYRAQLASPTVAVLRPSDNLFDFTVQQGVMAVFTRPSDPTWARVSALVTASPPGSIVYGYLSDTGEEETVAVATLSAAGLGLAATDTTRNLSFHVAVGADRPRQRASVASTANVAPCTSDTVNVVVGVTDGDNINVPLSHFPRANNWGSPRRGELPIGWSMGPDMAILAPAVWDSYATTATANDELVGMIGYAYAAPVLLPDPAGFYASSFALMDQLGMTTFWSLGGGLETPSAPGWPVLDTAAGTGVPHGVLVGYGNGTGDAFHSPAGRPAFTSRARYGDTPDMLRQDVLDLVATPAASRPAVTFLSATNWTNPVGDLIDALAPLQSQGVRFLTPSQAAACLPPAPPPPPPPPSACRPDPATITEHGLSLVSGPVAAEIKATPSALALGATVSGPATVAAGGAVTYEAIVPVDLGAFAHDVLEQRVKPIVAAGYGPELAATAWTSMSFDRMALRLAVPGATPVSPPQVSATGLPGATASWDGDTVVVSIDPATVDTRVASSGSALTIRFAVRAPVSATPVTLAVADAGLDFDLDLTVGVVLGQLPLQGGVAATWSCPGRPAALATTMVAGTGVTPSTTSLSTTTTGPPTSPSVTGAPATASTARPATALVARPSFTG